MPLLAARRLLGERLARTGRVRRAPCLGFRVSNRKQRTYDPGIVGGALRCRMPPTPDHPN